MIKLIKSLFTKSNHKKIVFMDGDQNLPTLLEAYDKHVSKYNTETHFIRMAGTNGANPPKALNDYDFNKIFLDNYRTSKETVDKFIAGYIQKAVDDGYKEITVISGDYDFIDIFKMSMMLNPNVTDVTFRMIVPRKVTIKKVSDEQIQSLNIEIIKD